jgi:hypothetical protein
MTKEYVVYGYTKKTYSCTVQATSEEDAKKEALKLNDDDWECYDDLVASTDYDDFKIQISEVEEND